MTLGSFVIGVIVGIVVTSVGLGEVVEILKGVVSEAIPIFLGLV